jgi:hypothetical protein
LFIRFNLFDDDKKYLKMSTVTLNVGGKNMVTYKSTLDRLEYFKNIFDRWNQTDNLFVDYDPDLFIHLLNKLRDDNYIMPDNDNIKSMCEFFGLSLSKISFPKIIKVKIIESSKKELNPKAILDIVFYGYYPNRCTFCAYNTDSSKILEISDYKDGQIYLKYITEHGHDFMLRKKYLKLLKQQNTNIYFNLKYDLYKPFPKGADLPHVIITMKV